MLSLKPFERHAIQFLLRHLAVGLGGAVLFAGLILAADLGGLRTLAWRDPQGWLYLLLLFFGLVVTFGSLAMGMAIMSLGEERDGPAEE